MTPARNAVIPYRQGYAMPAYPFFSFSESRTHSPARRLTNHMAPTQSSMSIHSISSSSRSVSSMSSTMMG